MKKIVFSSLVLFSCMLISCNDLLEKEPQAQIAEQNAYNTQDDALRAVTAAYTPLTFNNWCCTFTGAPGYMDWVMGTVASDDALKGGESGSDQVYAQQIQLFNTPADNDAVRFAWSSQYIGIRRANLVLDKVKDITMDEALKTRLLAEAKFLRGYYYFKLVKTFGGVPLILTTLNGVENLPRSSKEEVYAQVIKDLTEAEAVLPARSKQSGADYGRATKGAAQAYLGMVYLYMKDNAKAAEWFKKVIDSGEYALEPNFERLWSVAGENSKEIIFSVVFKNDNALPVNSQLGIVQGSRSMYGWGFNNPSVDLVNAFEPGDPRLKHTVYKSGDVMPDGVVANVGNTETGYLNKKAYIRQDERVGGAWQPGQDEIMMRYGKVLLWYAEASLELGNIDEALKALNQVRQVRREGNASVLPDITERNPAALRPIIWQEQRVEFALEGDRFFELVRQGRAEQVLKAFAQKYNTPKGAGFRAGVHEIYPVPALEISLSQGTLTQNPGY